MTSNPYPYNKEDKNSILSYALLLKDKSLRESIDFTDFSEAKTGNKGGFGQILEKFYFLKELDSESQPDFPEAGLELKSSPLKTLSKKEIRAKERLVLNIINYHNLIEQQFITSSFYTKNANLLLVFYLHSKNVDVLDYPIKLIGIWEFPEDDLKVIEHDWNLIRNKVADGQAHTLSEGDTFYLGACTKGANASSVRSQPFSDIEAKQRAFSLKAGYVNHILAKLSGIEDGSFGKIAPLPELEQADADIESIVINKLKPFYGLNPIEIANRLGVEFKTSKDRLALLTKAMLGISMNQQIEEFSKSDIESKTVRLSANGNPDQAISFPAFSYTDLIHESWEDSQINELIEKKFIFYFFQYQSEDETDENLVFQHAYFWNMDFNDRQKVKQVWEGTKQLISQGKIVKSIDEKFTDGEIQIKRKTYFPEVKNDVAHVRPHASKASDVYPLPVPDKQTKATEYTKHSFWLNKSYLRDIIFKKSMEQK